jgi:hypothetical protein
VLSNLYAAQSQFAGLMGGATGNPASPQQVGLPQGQHRSGQRCFICRELAADRNIFVPAELD